LQTLETSKFHSDVESQARASNPKMQKKKNPNPHQISFPTLQRKAFVTQERGTNEATRHREREREREREHKSFPTTKKSKGRFRDMDFPFRTSQRPKKNNHAPNMIAQRN